MEAGEDWSTLVTAAISSASELVRSITGKPIIKQLWATRDYDVVIRDGTAAIAVGRLVRPFDRDLAESLESYYNDEGLLENPKGLLQKVRDSEISLLSETTPVLGVGELVEVTVNASTTGGIDDIRGRATENDTVEVSIVTGGTFSYGSASAVTYQVKGKSSTGLMTSTLVAATTIHGDYQLMAHGLELRFRPGVYTASDNWYIRMSIEEIETHQALHSITMTVRG